MSSFTVAQPQVRRNEGGRYSVKSGSDWYKAQEEANIQAVEDAERALTTALAHQVGNAVAAMPEAAEQITKAAALVQARDVYPLTNGAYLVGSQSHPDDAYLVRRGPWRCTCPDHRYRDRTCKHIVSVWFVVKMGQAYQAQY